MVLVVSQKLAPYIMATTFRNYIDQSETSTYSVMVRTFIIQPGTSTHWSQILVQTSNFSFFNNKTKVVTLKPSGFTLIGTVKAFTNGIKNMEWTAAS